MAAVADIDGCVESVLHRGRRGLRRRSPSLEHGQDQQGALDNQPGVALVGAGVVGVVVDAVGVAREGAEPKDMDGVEREAAVGVDEEVAATRRPRGRRCRPRCGRAGSIGEVLLVNHALDVALGDCVPDSREQHRARPAVLDHRRRDGRHAGRLDADRERSGSAPATADPHPGAVGEGGKQRSSQRVAVWPDVAGRRPAVEEGQVPHRRQGVGVWCQVAAEDRRELVGTVAIEHGMPDLGLWSPAARP